MKSIIVKTVLKSGGEYKQEHVHRIYQQLDRYVDCPVKFVCYSDLKIPGFTTRPLIHDWSGWWSKIEMFKDIEDSFYIDLDMTIQGNITDMITVDSDFIALRNMNPNIEGIGSAMMKWRGDKSFIYEKFKSDPQRFITENSKIGTNKWGDQSFIWKEMGGDIDFYQLRFPARISRFDRPEGDVKVYYGRNRPWKYGL